MELMEETLIIFGNGESTTSNTKAHIGELEAIVCNDNQLTDDLVAIHPIVDAGYDIHFSSKGGMVNKPSDGHSFPILRDGLKWMINLEELKEIKIKRKPIYCNTVSIANQVLRLHERMGHPATEAMCTAISFGAWKNTKITAEQVRRVMKQNSCLPCLLAKKNKPVIPHPEKNNLSDLKIGELLSGDIIGKIQPATRDGDIYFYLFVDKRSGYMRAYTSKTKDGFVTALGNAISYFEDFGHKVKAFRSDSEQIMKWGPVKQLLESKGVQMQQSLPYAHYQNLVERYVQTIVKAVSTVLHGQSLLKANLWDHALFYVINCKNSTPNSKTGRETPSQMVTGIKHLDLQRENLFSFGELVIVRNIERTWKFDLKNDVALYLGHPKGTVNGGTVYYPFINKVAERADLTPANISENIYKQYYSTRYEIKELSTSKRLSELFANLEDEVETEDAVRFSTRLMDEDEIPNEITQQMNKKNASSKSIEAVEMMKHLPQELRDNFELLWNNHYKKDVNKPVPTDRVTCSIVSGRYVAALAVKEMKLKVKDVLKTQHSAKWIEAINIEVNSLINNFKCLIPEEINHERDYDCIHATIDLKVKYLDETTIDKYKARVCGCGNELVRNAAYTNETYSPTVAQLTHSVMLQLAIFDQMHMCSIDTVGAFLYQEYPESLKPLYVILPKAVAEVCNLNPKATYRVKKYIYGLPDSGRAYYIAYRDHLINSGYMMTTADPCLFIRLTKEIRTYVWIHVDDTIAASTHESEFTCLKNNLEQKFKITINGFTKHLGINIDHLESGAVKLRQRKLLGSLFEEYPPTGRKANQPQRISRNDASNAVDDQGNQPCDQREYLHLLGMLNYISHTRPDISTALSYAATKNTNPTTANFDELLLVVDYLWQTKEKGLILHPAPYKNAPLTLICHVDASYLAHEDAKSHTGYCLSFGKFGSFYSKSSKQKLVATSSTHAEIRALYMLVLDIIYIVHLCEEVGRPIDLPAIVFEDNQPVIDLTKTLSSKITRSKHFLMLIEFLREQVVEGLIELHKIPTESNTADLLTKLIVGKTFTIKAMHLLGEMGMSLNVNESFNELNYDKD
jgi:hypothetical protein